MASDQHCVDSVLERIDKAGTITAKKMFGEYGVYADGKFTAFDEAGSAKAKEALEKTSKANGAKFKVMCMVHDGKMMVESISEVE